MIQIISKNSKTPISKNLSHGEFRCRCDYEHCNYTLVNYRIGVLFEALRLKVNRPIYVTSGYRCNRHNFDTLDSNPMSKHQIGEAIDLACPDRIDIKEFHAYAYEVGFKYVYYNEQLNFIHCQLRGK
jgi:hypothetical protein